MTVEQRSRKVFDESSIRQIVKAEIAEYAPEIERMIGSAVKKGMRTHASDETLRAEKTVEDAFSAMPHVISSAYVAQEGIWQLFIIHDSDELGRMVEKLVDESVRVEGLPSVPLLELRVRHVSEMAHTPPEAKLLFAKR